MKKSIVFILLMLPFVLFGAYVKDVPIQLIQPDGVEISILASGDEFHHWFHDKAGYTITKNSQGFYVYAEKDGDDIIPSSLIVGQADPATKALQPKINITPEQWKEKRDEFYQNHLPAQERTPSTGQLINLVIFIKFQGESDFATDISLYDNMLNDPSSQANSVNNFYHEVSYGQLDVSGEFFPPVSPENTILAYEDSHPRGYYEAYSASNPIGYTGGDNGEERGYREHALLANAAEYVESMIPEDLAIDGDNDGYVDNVIYIIKGSPNNWASLLWPHRWTLYYEDAYIHGKRVWDFNFQIETHLNNSGTSVMCHELYHSLGAPDLYRYYSDGDPVGIWDLMANNTTPPQHMNSYMKYYYTNWIPEIPKIEESGTYSLKPVSSAENQVYRIQSWNYLEEIYLEYRRIDPLFESGLPNQGMLIYKINNALAGYGNADGPPDEVYVYRPNGNSNGGGQINLAPFNNNHSSFGLTSNPVANGTNGTFSGIDIYDIVVEEDSLTFKIDVSDIYFTSLNNGESLIAGGMNEISWIAKNNVTEIKLEYTTDQGENWILIDELNASQQGYDWLIPEINSNEVYLKITQLATGKYDIINQPLTLISDLTIPQTVYPEDNSTDISTNPVLTWDNVMGATGYTLQFTDDESFNQILIETQLEENQIELPSLNAYTSYYWKVKATNGSMSSPYSNLVSFTTGNFTSNPEMPVLTFPVNNSIQVSYENLEFAWEEVISASTYTLQVCENVYFYSDLVEVTDIETNSYNISELEPFTRYYWRVKSENSYGSSSWSSMNQFITQQVVSNDNNVDIISNKYLGNYPNPFNPETTISFSVGNSNKEKAQPVNVTIYNLKGQLVKELVDDNLTSGNYKYTWQGLDSHNNSVASGIYYILLKIGDETETGKMILMK